MTSLTVLIGVDGDEQRIGWLAQLYSLTHPITGNFRSTTRLKIQEIRSIAIGSWAFALKLGPNYCVLARVEYMRFILLGPPGVSTLWFLGMDCSCIELLGH